jgi:hypothetical protein
MLSVAISPLSSVVMVSVVLLNVVAPKNIHHMSFEARATTTRGVVDTTPK